MTTLVAISLFAWRERMRYLNEHLFVSVIDQSTGDLLNHFQYQTYVITSESGQDEDWSDWKTHQGPSVLTIAVPGQCRFQLRARAVDLAGGYSQKELSTLVLPELSHTAILRMLEGNSLQSFLVDSSTFEPIRDARIIPTDCYDAADWENMNFYRPSYFADTDFATVSDSQGRFVVRNLREEFTIDSPKHKRRIVKFEDASEEDLEDWRKNGIRLEPADPIYGQVTCQETGEPIPNCEVIFENSQFKVMTSEKLGEPRLFTERGEFDRVTRTDESGCFQLFTDGQSADCKVWFSKKGWVDESVGLSDRNIDIRLAPSPYKLSGYVVDETGMPVREFEVKTLSKWTNVETHLFSSDNGWFRIRLDGSILKYAVRAKGKGIFDKQFIDSWDVEEQTETDWTHQRVTLTDGFCVTGTIKGSRTELSNVSIALRPIRLFEIYDDNPFLCDQTQTGENGVFRFDHISHGTYTLVTSYFGRVVNTRPIVIESKNLRVDHIDLPPLGKIKGIALHEDGLASPFHRMYVTDHHGIPQKWFHTNHRGEFEMKNVPCGWYGIGPKPERFSLLRCGGRWSVDDMQFIEPGQTMEVSFRDIPVFGLRGLPRFAWHAINVKRLSAPSEIADLKTREIEQESRCTIRVISQSEVKDGDEFSLQMDKGKCQQELTLVYQANRKRHPNPILFHSCQLHFSSSDPSIPFEKTNDETQVNEPNSDDPFGDPFAETEDAQTSALQVELYVGRTTIYLLKQNQVVSKLSMIGLRENVPLQIDEREPDAAMIHNTKFGFARIDKLHQFDGDSPSMDVRFEEGAEIRGKMKLNGLPLLPSCIRVMDERGVTFVTIIRDDCTFEFKHLWPGKWSVQMIGHDPFLGEQVLAERQVVVEGAESQSVNLHASHESM